LIDFLSLQASLLAGYWFWILFPWHGHYQLFSDYSLLLWIHPPIGITVFKAVGLYKPEMGVIGVQEQSLIFKAIWIIYFTFFAFSFFYREVHFSRLAIFYSIFIAILLISVERYLFRRFFESLRARGIAVRKALIYGAGYQGKRLARLITQSPQLGIQVVGFLDDAIEKISDRPASAPWLGGLEQLKKAATTRNISLLFIAYRNLPEAKVLEIFQHAQEAAIQCWAIPSLYEFHIEKIRITNIGGIPLLGLQEDFGRKSYLKMKRLLDLMSALCLAPFFLPLGLAIAAALRISQKGAVFFKQPRVGEDGKKFVMLKFRTLKEGSAKEEISPELQKKSKPVTPWIAFLRRSGLDELPQFLNVLRGEMSVIGPRPEMPFIVEKYGPLERERLSVKPGITGLWQISEDRKRLLIHENMDYDLYYVEHLSFNLDLAILVKTVLVVIRRMCQAEAAKRR